MLALTDVIKLKMIKYFAGDHKRINHALKVHSFAHLIAVAENIDAPTTAIIEIAAFLHDIGIKEAERKYHSSSGKYQELEGPDVAKELLAPFSLEEDTLNRILYLIGNHHSYSKIDGIDFQILVESDFIVNIYEDELDESALQVIKTKYFKTSQGIDLINAMFL